MDISTNNEIMINTANAERSKNVFKNVNASSSEYEMKQATQDFEAIFLNMVIQAMWKTIPESGMFEKNSVTNIYEGIIKSALSDGLSKDGGIGIGKMLYQQLSKENN